jgi:hypothetical protein
VKCWFAIIIKGQRLCAIRKSCGSPGETEIAEFNRVWNCWFHE